MSIITVGGASGPEDIIFSSDNYQIEIKTYPNIEIGDIKPIDKKGDHDTTLFLTTLFIFVIIEIFDKIPWILFRLIIILFIIAIVISLYRDYGIKSFSYIRMNHGAEHKVINAYLRGNINNVEREDRFAKKCGSNFIIPLLIIILLGDWIRYPFILSMIYYVLYMKIKLVRDICFNMIGKYVQYLLTKEPSSDILIAAKIGLLKLIKEEEKIRE